MCRQRLLEPQTFLTVLTADVGNGKKLDPTRQKLFGRAIFDKLLST